MASSAPSQDRDGGGGFGQGASSGSLAQGGAGTDQSIATAGGAGFSKMRPLATRGEWAQYVGETLLLTMKA